MVSRGIPCRQGLLYVTSNIATTHSKSDPRFYPRGLVPMTGDAFPTDVSLIYTYCLDVMGVQLHSTSRWAGVERGARKTVRNGWGLSHFTCDRHFPPRIPLLQETGCFKRPCSRGRAQREIFRASREHCQPVYTACCIPLTSLATSLLAYLLFYWQPVYWPPSSC